MSDDYLYYWRCMMYPTMPLAIAMQLNGCNGRYNHILAVVLFSSLAIGILYRWRERRKTR